MRFSRPLIAAALALAVATSPAFALHNRIPAFARKYGISCAVCHQPVPRLTPTGEKFANNGFEFEPGEEPRDTIATGDALLRLQRTLPLAVRFDAYSSVINTARSGQSNLDIQSPWVIKLLSGGQVANKVSYYTYFLLTERGEVGGLEDAYLQFTDIKSSGVSVIVGQFQMSDPLFKRELRLSYDDYQPYRMRVGQTVADLTYERGLMALWSPREGTDFAAAVVNGRGLGAANDQRQFDGDTDKNFMFRLSQDLGSALRVGAFVYGGNEKQNDTFNEIRIWGPDATLALGDKAEVNFQYVLRKDDDPFFGTCSVADPCPGGRTRAFSSTTKAAFAEAILSPQGPGGRVFFTGLYNWAEADAPVMSLRLGEQAEAPGYLSKYQTASAGVHYVYRRNMRFLGEGMWDFEREQARVVLGLVVGF